MSKIIHEILSFLDDTGKGVEEFLKTPYGKLRVNKIPKQTLYTQFYRLEKEGLVKKFKDGKKVVFQITQKGKDLARKIEPAKRRSDGLSTIVIFDIPEHLSAARRMFRRYLQRNGYNLIQKSVFAAPIVLSSEVRSLASELGIRQYVSIINGVLDKTF